MQITYSLETIPSVPSPIGLSIGSFDGIHRGHQFLIKTLRSFLGKEGTLALITFSNHPADVLSGRKKVPLLCSLRHKLILMEKEGVDLAIVIPFTREFSEIPYDIFLKRLLSILPFSTLVLGKGAAFGKNREGNEENILKAGQELQFTPIYLNKETYEGESFSSGLIRTYLMQGNLTQVTKLLGRPYSLFGEVNEAQFLDTEGLCLPPAGIYPIVIKKDSIIFQGKAHINQDVRLECKENLLGCAIEAIFL